MKKALLTSTAVLALGMFGFGISAASAAPLLGVDNTPVAVTTGNGSSSTSVNKSAIADGNTVGSYNHSGNGNLDGNALDNGNTTASGNKIDNGNTTASTRDAHDTATSATGDAINNSTLGSFNGNSATTGSGSGGGSGGGVAATTGGTAIQLNGSADHLDAGAVLSNGTLTATSSFNHVDVDLTLAKASAGGKMGGVVTNNNQNGDHDGYGGGFYANENGSDVSNNILGSTGVITANANGNGIAQFNTSVAAVGVDNTSSLMSH